jgi:hypothetical protein
MAVVQLLLMFGVLAGIYQLAKLYNAPARKPVVGLPTWE